jgi:hypothetical protein
MNPPAIARLNYFNGQRLEADFDWNRVITCGSGAS